MRIRTALKWVFGFCALALAAGPAGAQPASPQGNPSAGGDGPNAPTATDGQVGFQRKTTLTPQEQVAEATKHITRMEGASTGVRRMLGQAREQRDVVKTLCLNDKLSQIDVTTRSAKDRKVLLVGAANRNDVELANHEFTIITVYRQRVEVRVGEANQCIGEEAAFVGDTKTTVKIDPQIPPDETPYPPTDPTLVIGPPQCTSCEL